MGPYCWSMSAVWMEWMWGSVKNLKIIGRFELIVVGKHYLCTRFPKHMR